MTCGDVKYYLKVIRKGYKDISPLLALTNFVMIVLIGLLGLLLLVYEPADEWHNTTFTLSHFEYRYSRGGGVLYLYTTDNRSYALNHNEGEIRYQLKEGQQYKAVYSADLFHDVIKGLEDTEHQYINADEMRKSHEMERVWFVILLILSVSCVIIINSLYANFCVREEKRKIQRRLRKRR